MSHLLIVKRLELYMDLALYKINILLLLCHRHQNSRLCSRPHSHESVIFFRIFGIHSVYAGHFVEYMNMHAMNMWLTDAADGGCGGGRIGLCTHACNTLRRPV